MDPLPVLTVGDARLRQIAVAVGPGDAGLAGEIAAMQATLEDFRRGYGYGRALAAPQVGIGKRVVVMHIGGQAFALVNPEITWRSAECFEVWDDCLSVPDRVVRVKRNRSVSLTYLDEQYGRWEWTELPADLAELVQHEIDHLDGILMLDRAWGEDAIRPIEERARLIGTVRPERSEPLGAGGPRRVG
jgi:peptide deformylase